MARARRNRTRRVGLVALVALSLTAATAASRRGAPTTTPARRVVVQAGDTLWALSARCGVPDADRRELVWVVQRLNGLTRARLQPGQALLLPLGPVAYKSALSDPAGFARRATVHTDPPASLTYTVSR